MVVIVRQGLGNRTLSDVVSEWQAARGRILRRYAELSDTQVPNSGVGTERPVLQGGGSEGRPTQGPGATRGG